MDWARKVGIRKNSQAIHVKRISDRRATTGSGTIRYAQQRS